VAASVSLAGNGLSLAVSPSAADSVSGSVAASVSLAGNGLSLAVGGRVAADLGLAVGCR
jgi:hypothetical protein